MMQKYKHLGIILKVRGWKGKEAVFEINSRKRALQQAPSLGGDGRGGRKGSGETQYNQQLVEFHSDSACRGHVYHLPQLEGVASAEL